MFEKKNMVFLDYNWNNVVSAKRPDVISYNDTTKLNRYDGNEMLFYIICLSISWGWKPEAIRACQKLEKTIRLKVPSEIETYGAIKKWIEYNFKDFWESL